MAKHLCKYCGIEFDPSMSMCPACGYKNEKIILPEKKKEPEVFSGKKDDASRIDASKIDASKDTGKKPVEKTPEKPVFVKKEEDYRKELERLEKSMFGGKETPADTSAEKPVKEKAEVRKEPVKEVKKEVKKDTGKEAVKKETGPSGKIPALAKLFFHSKAAYLVWFFIGFAGMAGFSGFRYSVADWYMKSAGLLFGNNIQAEAELRNVHHLLNDFNPLHSYNILNGDVLFFLPVAASLLPVLLWLIKRKSKSVENPGNSNVFAGFIITLILASVVLAGMRIFSYSNLLFRLLLSVVFFAPVLDLGVFLAAFKQRSFNLRETIVIALYSIGIPLVLVSLSGFFDYAIKFIVK